MDALKESRMRTAKDIEEYLKRVPKEQRLEWLKDGDEWFKEYKHQNGL